ncbi:hypothetical protein FRB97_000563 [Tulasnella sp. 331]|nr:hypothetical protein FRB97_000563 [Tulasnella sp. 331]
MATNSQYAPLQVAQVDHLQPPADDQADSDSDTSSISSSDYTHHNDPEDSSLLSTLAAKWDGPDPFNPPPPSWQRPINAPCRPPFNTIVLQSNHDHDLSTNILHSESSRPFNDAPTLENYDVSQDDWRKLFDDLDGVTRLTLKDHAKRELKTSLWGLTGPGAFFVHQKMKKGAKGRKVSLASVLIERWNLEFFRPRKLDVYLSKGTHRLTGPFPNAPTPVQVSGGTPVSILSDGSQLPPLNAQATKHQRKAEEHAEKHMGHIQHDVEKGKIDQQTGVMMVQEQQQMMATTMAQQAVQGVQGGAKHVEGNFALVIECL